MNNTNSNLLKRRAPFMPRNGEIVVRDPPRLARESRVAWSLALAVAVLALCLTAWGCYDEASRAVLQCADENVRCTHVIDELCQSDPRYCDYQPWSNRGAAIAACRQAYEDCFATATGTRTPDRYEWVDGGAPNDGGAR